MARNSTGGMVAAGLLALVIAAALIALAGGWLSLDLVHDISRGGARMVAAHPLVSMAVLFAAVTVMTALCFPVAPLIGMTGGSLFGLWTGFALVLAVTALGSTLACLGSRFLFRDWIAARFARRLARIDAGLETHGAAYLLSIRLNPVIPYWPVNLAFGCTHMPIRHFLPLTLVGLAPSIFVYALAGTHLADLDHLNQVASTEIVAGMLVLSLIPLAFDRLILKRRA